jgi:hypothetical protein
MKSLPIANCRLPIEMIADCQLPIAELKTLAVFPFLQLNSKLPVAVNRQSTIGNRQCSYAAT